MSDSDSDDFRDGADYDSGSDAYAPQLSAPVKKGAKATKSVISSKASAAKKGSNAKQPLRNKENLPNDSISEDDASAVSSSHRPHKDYLRLVAEGGDAVNTNAQKKPAKDASEMYQKLSQLEHVLKRPDSYIGSVEAVTQMMWVYNEETKMMTHRNTTFVPGFFKIFDEILVNAADNKINDATMDTIKVCINREKNQISVYNNGRGIPVEKHKKEQIMIPEMIFGHLLTSSNYDDDQKKLTGGRNGYGAKLANIYSLEFVVETADKVNAKKYKQVFSQNMGKKGTPKITENKKGEEWTKITFTPDLKRFGMSGIDDDTYALLMKRVYDMAGTVRDVKVFLNEERIKVKNFKQYVEMYLNAASQATADATGGAATPKPTMIYEQVNERWEVAFALSDGQPQHVSFANSISTTKGGTHVDMVSTQLANKLMDQIKKRNKAAPVKPFQVKNHMWIFVNALVENPAFDSQTKDTLTLKSSAFGSKCDLSEDFIKKVAKSGIIDNVLSWAKFKQDQIMKKTDGAKRTRISGIAKLEDANNAGGRNARKCTLILTEGDSAKALAVSGLGVVGRDDYGVFPLRGKLLNVREAAHDQIIKNVEIQHLKQILGLKHNQDYTTVDSLRYGHLMIMTDQDHDGSHIKGLIINFLDHFYPSLLRIPEFLVEFVTPIVKVTKGKQEISFYTLPQYEEWKEGNNEGRGWEAKYYKGLGTSTSADAKKYFSDLGKHRLAFEAMLPEDRALIDMAFNKKKADDRKEWLRQYKPGTFLDHNVETLPISDFVNKELILFSMADNIRSIPSVADGLKPGQRKVLYGCFKKNLVKEIKVAQLAGFVSEKTAYHHGEQSLTATIVGLAQNFVGSNNINLLDPRGQFGTRLAGGKDAASARYIFTAIPRMTRAIFHPADDGILNYLMEEGMTIEPEYYLPVIPMVLVNGADGIGTGWSTAIPNYNPEDIVENIRRMMRGEEPETMVPWFRGFKGSIERTEAEKYKVSGLLEKVDDTTLDITELPIRRWTQDFKEMLEECTTGTDKVPASIKDYEEHHTDTTVHFRVHMTESSMRSAEQEGLEKRFKLTTTISTGNMVCFDLNGKIRKYANAEEILKDFYQKRLEYYGIRKQYLADEINRQFERLSNQARFVQMIIDKKLSISKKRRAVLEAELRVLKFRPFSKSSKKSALVAEEAEPAMDEENDVSAGDFDYLLGMAIWSLTAEKVEKLLAERDVKEQELIALLKLSPHDIWNTDLDAFLVEWASTLAEDEATARGAKPKSKAAIKAAAKKKKRATGDESDESDDFIPIKPAARAKAKAASGKVSPAKRTNAHMSDASEKGSKPPAKKAISTKKMLNAQSKPLIELAVATDDELYNLPQETKASTAKPPKQQRKVIAAISSSGSDDEPVVIKKAPSKSKAKVSPVNQKSETESDTVSLRGRGVKAKAKRKDDDSDFEGDETEDYQEIIRKPAARVGRGMTKSLAYIEPSDEDSDE